MLLYQIIIITVYNNNKLSIDTILINRTNNHVTERLYIILYTISLGDLITLLLVFVLIVIVGKLTVNCNNN